MAGKPLTAIDGSHAHMPKLQRAFCDGMAYRAGGTLLERPLIDNPHYLTGDVRQAEAWGAGWLMAELESGSGDMPPSNCAVYGPVPL